MNNQSHRDLRVMALVSDERNFVAVVAGEFPHLAPHYPIFFSKDSETGAFYCGAMLGFDEGENLFVAEGRNVYRPLNLQRGPFFVAGSDIAIDLDSPKVGSGELLFDESGAPSVYLKSIMALFRDLVPGMEQTRIFIEVLLGLKLIEPIDINLSFDDGTRRSLAGLYTINQEALRDLADADVLMLFRRGYLHLIYLMISSLAQVKFLAQRKNTALRAGLGLPR
nr:SapC family protein [Rhizomicrobium palustre]